MANAGGRGRPIAPLVLSAQERAYLERQVRRHRVARSLSERCRAILRCADGLPSKSVAAELGIHEHTGGLYRRVPHDRHRNEPSSFQIGVSGGRRMASSGILAPVLQRLHHRRRLRRAAVASICSDHSGHSAASASRAASLTCWRA